MRTLCKFTVLSVTLALVILVVAPAALQAQEFPSRGDDDQASLGIFRIAIDPDYHDLIEALLLQDCGPEFTEEPCYTGEDPAEPDEQPYRLMSPVLVDEADEWEPRTIVVRSDMHLNGPSELVSYDVGEEGSEFATTVGDGDMNLRPAAFQTNEVIEEVHIALAQMKLYHWFWEGIRVRAGHALNSSVTGLPLRKCAGEVESLEGSGLPGRSFFNVYVEVTIEDPGSWGRDMILYNDWPLVITNYNLVSLPPTVVYVHEGYAVPLRFAENNGSKWSKDDVLGMLTLAGHGYDFSSGKSGSLQQFLDAMNQHFATVGEMPPPPPDVIPTLTEWGLIIFCVILFGWMAWMIVRRRKVADVRM